MQSEQLLKKDQMEQSLIFASNISAQRSINTSVIDNMMNMTLIDTANTDRVKDDYQMKIQMDELK